MNCTISNYYLKNSKLQDYIRLIIGSYRIWILPDLPDSDFAGFEILKSGNPAGIPAGTFSPDYPAGLPDYPAGLPDFKSYKSKISVDKY